MQTEMFTQYFNTTRLTGTNLHQAITQAETQGDIIYEFYKDKHRLSPSMVLRLAADYGYRWPITSVRRAITVLTEQGKLVKTHNTVDGAYGKPEHVWVVRY